MLNQITHNVYRGKGETPFCNLSLLAGFWKLGFTPLSILENEEDVMSQLEAHPVASKLLENASIGYVCAFGDNAEVLEINARAGKTVMAEDFHLDADPRSLKGKIKLRLVIDKFGKPKKRARRSKNNPIG